MSAGPGEAARSPATAARRAPDRIDRPDISRRLDGPVALVAWAGGLA
ncbi:hypothetical protein [Streptomyces sioyaensis]